MWKRRRRRFLARARTRRERRVHPDHAYDRVDGVFFETLQFSKVRDRNELSIDIKSVESLAFRPARDIGVKTFARFYKRRENLQRAAFRSRLDLFHYCLHALPCDRQITVRTELLSGFRE